MGSNNLRNDMVGVDADAMEDVCNHLRFYSGEMDELIEELNTLTKALPEDWQGDDLEIFTAEFMKFEAELSKMPSIIEKIATWCEGKKNAYEEEARNVSKITRDIFTL